MDGDTRGHRPLSRAIRSGLILAAFLAACPAWAETYRWVDDQGGIHYSDTLPPQHAGKGYKQLNPQGRVVKEVEQAPTSPEARARAAQEAARAEAQAREERDHLRRDSALLAIYNSVEELDLARKRALDQESAMIESLNVMRQHSGSKAETDHIDAMIKLRQAAIETIKAKFDADRARYLELRRGR